MTSTATIPVLTDRDSEQTGLGRRSPQAGTAALAALENFNVWFTDDAGGAQHVVHDVSLGIHPGECVAVIGESGSGKSVTARSLIGLSGPTPTFKPIAPPSVRTVFRLSPSGSGAESAAARWDSFSRTRWFRWIRCAQWVPRSANPCACMGCGTPASGVVVW